MATWRRRDLERRASERGRRLSRALPVELVVAALALVVAGAALQQAMAAQSRAELLAHDLAAANARLRSMESLAPPAATPDGEAAAPSEPASPPGMAPR